MFVIADDDAWVHRLTCLWETWSKLWGSFVVLFLPYLPFPFAAMSAIRRKFSHSSRSSLPYVRPAQGPVNTPQRQVCISGLVEWFARLMLFSALEFFKFSDSSEPLTASEICKAPQFGWRGPQLWWRSWHRVIDTDAFSNNIPESTSIVILDPLFWKLIRSGRLHFGPHRPRRMMMK